MLCGRLGDKVVVKYFEDVAVGDTFDSPRSVRLTRDEIMSFAAEWDPQLYHIDEEVARNSFVEEVFASAIHTLAISQKLAHESGFFEISPIVGLGISDIRLPKPVLAGDSVRVRVTVQEMRPSKSRPQQGVITILNELINQDDELVLSFALSELVRMRASRTTRMDWTRSWPQRCTRSSRTPRSWSCLSPPPSSSGWAAWWPR